MGIILVEFGFERHTLLAISLSENGRGIAEVSRIT
jgi:hypothetical protein